MSDKTTEQPKKISKRGKTLTKPKRLDLTPAKKEQIIQLKNELTQAAEAKLVQDEEFYECVSCKTRITAPYPTALKRLIHKIKKNDAEYLKEQQDAHKIVVEQCKKDGTSPPTFTFIKGGLSKNDKEFICRTHKVELEMKPLRVEKNWPEKIDFSAIRGRVERMEEDMLSIIERKKESIFLKKVMDTFEELGADKARQISELMLRFTESLPGYYGNRGSHALMDALNDLFLKTDKLHKKNANPLTPVEFCQQVLVPEVGSRLIMQDMNLNTLEEARKVMQESIEYGSIVYYKNKK